MKRGKVRIIQLIIKGINVTLVNKINKNYFILKIKMNLYDI